MIRRDGDKEIPEPFADEVIAMCTIKFSRLFYFLCQELYDENFCFCATFYIPWDGILTNTETCSHFFYQAKFFTESRLLQREVKIILEGIRLI